MIDLDDLNPHAFALTENQERNLIETCRRFNLLEEEYLKQPGAKHFIIPSGFRSMADHYRIYKDKGIDHPPLGSRHLTGEAADVAAEAGSPLKTWILSNSGLYWLEKIVLYCEHFETTPHHIHFQTCPPASGKRFFYP